MFFEHSFRLFKISGLEFEQIKVLALLLFSLMYPVNELSEYCFLISFCDEQLASLISKSEVIKKSFHFAIYDLDSVRTKCGYAAFPQYFLFIWFKRPQCSLVFFASEWPISFWIVLFLDSCCSSIPWPMKLALRFDLLRLSFKGYISFVENSSLLRGAFLLFLVNWGDYLNPLFPLELRQNVSPLLRSNWEIFFEIEVPERIVMFKQSGEGWFDMQDMLHVNEEKILVRGGQINVNFH